MSVEAQQRFEISRLTAKVNQLQELLRDSTSQVESLQNLGMSGTGSEQLQTLQAELDHERQKTKAIWAAVRLIAGEETARRIEDEVSRRPIVAAPKVRRRGTMPHVPAPHMAVVAKTTATPKWPPSTQDEEPESAPTVIPAEPAEGSKFEFDVDIGSVPPSVARRLFGGARGKDQKESGTAAEPMCLLGNLNRASEPQNARITEIPSPMRRRETAASLSFAPPLPKPKGLQPQAEQARADVSVRRSRAASTAAFSLPQNSAESPPPPQAGVEGCADGNATPVMTRNISGTSVRERIRQLELSACRASTPDLRRTL